MAEVINFIISGIMDCFDVLRNFEFLGTNMLAFLITISIIGVLLPIIFTIGRGFFIPNENKPVDNFDPKEARHSAWSVNRRHMLEDAPKYMDRDSWRASKRW